MIFWGKPAHIRFNGHFQVYLSYLSKPAVAKSL